MGGDRNRGALNKALTVACNCCVFVKGFMKGISCVSDLKLFFLLSMMDVNVCLHIRMQRTMFSIQKTLFINVGAIKGTQGISNKLKIDVKDRYGANEGNLKNVLSQNSSLGRCF